MLHAQSIQIYLKTGLDELAPVSKLNGMMINELNNVYPQAQPKSEDEQAKADELAKAEQALADAQAKVNELQN